jgi:hypothetical protein
MADTKRQLICTALDTGLKTILVANGYNTNLGANVFEWRTAPFELTDLPGVIWRDISEDDSNATTGTIGYHNHDLKIELKISAASGSVTPAEIRKLLADVQRMIGVDPTWGKLALRTSPVSNEIDVEQAEKIIGGITIAIVITYQTKKWNPYA